MEFPNNQMNIDSVELDIADESTQSQTGSIPIELEHAYANSDDALQQDQLTMSQEIAEIKTEIKMEDIEIKQEETDSVETEFSPESEYYEQRMDTSFGNMTNHSMSIDKEYLPFNAESVPKEVYMELQEKHKDNWELLLTSNALIDSLRKENLGLRTQITNLKKQQRKVDVSIHEKSQLFYSDLKKMNEKHLELQKAMNSLKQENAKYRKRFSLNEYLSPEASDTLQVNVSELKKRADHFVEMQKEAITNIRVLKDEIDKKEKENRDAKLKLDSTLKLLTYFKRQFVTKNNKYTVKTKLVTELQETIKKFIEDHKAKSLYMDKEIGRWRLCLVEANDKIAKKDVEITQLKNCVATGTATYKALEKSTTCKDIEITNLKKSLGIARSSDAIKESNLKMAKVEIDNLKNSISMKETVNKVLKDKYNKLMGNFEKKVQESNQEVIKCRKKLIEYKKHMSVKYLEIEKLKNNITVLKNEIQTFKTKTCDYCGL